jgi:DNA-binding MarR family transcriptional regulator
MRTSEGEAATELILQTFRANGLLLASGDRLASPEGLTSARWQVLGALALAERPLTVPQIARRMGLSRQSVHATVRRLENDGFLEPAPNIDHRRSPFVRLTPTGAARYASLDERQIEWVNQLASGLPLADVQAAVRVLATLSERLTADMDGQIGGE